jgi:MFS family permease
LSGSARIHLYKNSPAAFVGVFFVGISQGALLTLTPLYGSQIGLSTNQSAFYAAAIVGGGLIAQWPVGRLSDRMDRRVVLIILGLATISRLNSDRCLLTERIPDGSRHRCPGRHVLTAALRDCRGARV